MGLVMVMVIVYVRHSECFVAMIINVIMYTMCIVGILKIIKKTLDN